MASENLCSAVPQHRRSPLGSNQRSGQEGREIELLKSRVAELERKFDESRNEVRQVMAELEMLQRTIDQRNQQVETLENEIQFQVGYINSRGLLSEINVTYVVIDIVTVQCLAWWQTNPMHYIS